MPGEGLGGAGLHGAGDVGVGPSDDDGIDHGATCRIVCPAPIGACLRDPKGVADHAIAGGVLGIAALVGDGGGEGAQAGADGDGVQREEAGQVDRTASDVYAVADGVADDAVADHDLPGIAAHGGIAVAGIL